MMLLRGRRGRVTVWAVSLAVLVAASQVSAPGESASEVVFGDGDSGRIVLAVRAEGGYVLEEWDAKRVAAPVLFADGRLLFPDGVGSEGTLYSRVRETVLDEWAIEAVATLIVETGFPDIGSAVTRFDDGIADASWWVLTYFDAAEMGDGRSRWRCGVLDPFVATGFRNCPRGPSGWMGRSCSPLWFGR